MPVLRTRDTQSQSLEVITDTLQPPALAIISPTPRALSFPLHHPNDATPSPTHSPFEPDLRKLTLTPPSSSLVRSFSPDSPDSSSTSVFSTSLAASTPSSHKRRKSSTCSDIERRPKKGDEDYIKRPENAFILFRRKCCEDRQQEEASAPTDGPTKKQRQADLSKTISQQWKALSPEERLYWEELAKEKKKEHEQMYPNYVYRPQRSKDKRGKKGRRGELGHEQDSEHTISFVLPLTMPATTSKHGRSVSAPTPPPCQTIQIPSVYMPSCPTSPSLVPMISRRSSHPDHATSAQFDFAMSHQQYHRHDPFPVVDGMFDDPSALHSLSIPPDMSMLQANQMISPSSSIASDSPCPPSPDAGAFSPIHCMQASLPYTVPSCTAPSLTDAQIGDVPLTGGPLSNVSFGYAPPSFASWEGESSWESQHDLLTDDEFDMNAIPPIELGIPGCGNNTAMPTSPATVMAFDVAYPSGSSPMSMDACASQYSAEGSHTGPETFEQLFDFESMLAVQQGY
ncbi:hypothetical protein EV401DRAFT_1999097 [Pisolithus croceorrhizus]|nr:hypothetical protein EV401DRAFT_1999097 [Pisolithus croceorrhizus]